MKTTYILGIDVAKQKVRAALRGAADAHFLFEKGPTDAPLLAR
jgi:hypothetical protein